jgi:hypothetical protein
MFGQGLTSETSQLIRRGSAGTIERIVFPQLGQQEV